MRSVDFPDFDVGRFRSSYHVGCTGAALKCDYDVGFTFTYHFLIAPRFRAFTVDIPLRWIAVNLDTVCLCPLFTESVCTTSVSTNEYTNT